MLLASGQRLYLNGLVDIDETTKNEGQYANLDVKTLYHNVHVLQAVRC